MTTSIGTQAILPRVDYRPRLPMLRTDAAPLQMQQDVQPIVNEYLEVRDVNNLTGVNRWHTSQYGCQRVCPEGKLCYTRGRNGCALGTEQEGRGVVRCCQFTYNLRFLSVAKEMTKYKIADLDGVVRTRDSDHVRGSAKRIMSNIDIPEHTTGQEPFFRADKTHDDSGNPFPARGFELILKTPFAVTQEDPLPRDVIDDLVRLGAKIHPNMLTVVATPDVYNELNSDLRSQYDVFFKLHTTDLTPVMLGYSPNMELDVSADSVDGGVVLSNLLLALEAQSTEPTRKRMHVKEVLRPEYFWKVIAELASPNVALKGEIEIYSHTLLFKDILTGQFGRNLTSSKGPSHLKITGLEPTDWLIDGY